MPNATVWEEKMGETMKQGILYLLPKLRVTFSKCLLFFLLFSFV